MIRNILWDVDGTLFNTYPAITYAISKSLNEMGLSVAMNMIDGLARKSIGHCVETLSLRFNLDPDLLRRQFVESYRMVDPVNQPPFSGVREVCEFIYTRDGMNIAITHRDIRSTRTLLETHAFSEYFEDIFSVEQGYPRNPNPALVIAALNKYALEPDRTLLVGDRRCDIQAGQAAGVRTCLFGVLDLDILADIHISDYNQLIEILSTKRVLDSTNNRE